jgi:hypothetical protein|tara:strand:- start:257 stop:1057 length:801 start_codon:yes stop_codon:yes gene_type:complete
MAIDFDALRKKLGQLSGTNSRRNTMWRPTEGEEAVVRLLAFADNEDGLPFAERWFYYNIGTNPGLLAPYQFGNPDPIQELITKLRDEGTKESYDLAKKLYPKARYYAPVVVRGEEEKGVRIWSFGKTVYQSLLNIMLDEDYGDITDPVDGRDIKVVCSKAPGRQWATTEVRPRGKTCALGETTKQMKDWTDAIPAIGDMYEEKSVDVLTKIVNDWLNGDDEASGNSYGTSRNDAPTKAPSASTSKPSVDSKFKSLDDAFADLEDDF